MNLSDASSTKHGGGGAWIVVVILLLLIILAVVYLKRKVLLEKKGDGLEADPEKDPLILRTENGQKEQAEDPR